MARPVVAPVGWQTAVSHCKLHDQWLGWSKGLQLEGLRLIGNDTSFWMLPDPRDCSNQGSRVLDANLQRLRADWQAETDYPPELAEGFVAPSRGEPTLCHGFTLDP